MNQRVAIVLAVLVAGVFAGFALMCAGDSFADTHSDSNPYPNRYPDSHGNGNPHADRDPYTHADGVANTDRVVDAHTNGDANTDSAVDAHKITAQSLWRWAWL